MLYRPFRKAPFRKAKAGRERTEHMRYPDGNRRQWRAGEARPDGLGGGVTALRDTVQIIDNLELGGAQRLLVTLAGSGGESRDLRVMSLHRGGPFGALLEAEGAQVTELAGIRIWNPLSIPRIAAALRRAGARCVHVHLTYATILAAPAARLAGARVVVSLHNSDTVGPGSLRARLLGWLEAMSLRHFTDHVIFVGDNVERANRARLGRTPGVTVRNVIAPPKRLDPGERAQLRAELGAGEEDVVIIAAGRISEQKDPLLLIRAFAAAQARLGRLRLWVVGDGDMRPEAERLARALGQEGRIVFAGMRTDVHRLFGAADVFALSSLWEGLPVALLEAMAAGLPVVSTDVGDIPHVLGAADAVLVPAGNETAFADALERVGADAAVRAVLAARAAEAARPHVDVAAWRARLERIYDGDA